MQHASLIPHKELNSLLCGRLFSSYIETFFNYNFWLTLYNPSNSAIISNLE